MDDDIKVLLAEAKAANYKLRLEVLEYSRAEKVLIAAGHVDKEQVEQAHEIVSKKVK